MAELESSHGAGGRVSFFAVTWYHQQVYEVAGKMHISGTLAGLQFCATNVFADAIYQASQSCSPKIR